jgi:hypothetical protein
MNDVSIEKMPDTAGSVLAHRLVPKMRTRLELAFPWLGAATPIVVGASIATAVAVPAAMPVSCFVAGSSLLAMLTSRKARTYQEPLSPINDSPQHYAQLCRSLIESANFDERRHLYMGVFDQNPECPFLLDSVALGRHLHILGLSGHGKTHRILAAINLQLLSRAASRQFIVDLKGDAAFFNLMRAHAPSVGLPFEYFTPVSSGATHVWDVLNDSAFLKLSDDVKASTLCQAFGIEGGQSGNKRFFSNQNTEALGLAFSQYVGRVTFKGLIELIESKAFRSRNMILDHQFNFLSDLRTMLRWALRIPAINPPPGLPEAEHGIDIGKSMSTPGVTYFSLPSECGETIMQILGRLAVRIINAHGRACRNQTQCYVTVDEFQQVVHSSMLAPLKMGRNSTLSFLLAHQSLDDLNTEDRDFTGVVTGAASTRMACSVTDERGRRQFALASGEKIYLHKATTETTTYNDDGTTRSRSQTLSEYIGTALTQNDFNRLNAISELVLVEAAPHSGFTCLNRPVLVRMPFPISSEWHEYYEKFPWPEPVPGLTVRADAHLPSTPAAVVSPQVAEPPTESQAEPSGNKARKKKRKRGQTPEQKETAEQFAERLKRRSKESQ